MKKILIVYNTMCIGGSTTSLVSILKNIDYSRYKIDLLLSDTSSGLIDMIPSEVNLLPQAYPKNLTEIKRKSIISNLKYAYGKIITYKKRNYKNIMGQIMCYENARFSRKINEQYDLAISFLENFPLNYVSKYVNATRKIAWIHVDYIQSGFLAKLDHKCYSKFEKFVLVSEECKKSFQKAFPEYKEKAIVIENILTSNTIKQLSKKDVDFIVDKQYINLVTVCRITFSHKGLDRIINALIKMKKEKIKINIRWYVIGDGIDYTYMKSLVEKNNLTEYIFLLGKKINPFPYEVKMDAFILPSRYEGKPMAITEAQMLGIPPIVTEYSSAHEQINNMYDGIIVNNDDESMFNILKKINENDNILGKLRENLLKNKYDNLSQLNKIYDLIEGKKYE